MGVIEIVLLVFFVISAVLLIIIVLLQDEQGEGVGGLFGGGNANAFGSRSGNIITKTTTVLAAIFFVTSFTYGWLNRTPEKDTLLSDYQEIESEEGNWWEKSDIVEPSTDIITESTVTE